MLRDGKRTHIRCQIITADSTRCQQPEHSRYADSKLYFMHTRYTKHRRGSSVTGTSIEDPQSHRQERRGSAVRSCRDEVCQIIVFQVCESCGGDTNVRAVPVADRRGQYPARPRAALLVGAASCMIASGLTAVIHTPPIPTRALATEWPTALASRDGQFLVRSAEEHAGTGGE